MEEGRWRKRGGKVEEDREEDEGRWRGKLEEEI